MSVSLTLRASSVRRATASTRILRLDLAGAPFPYLAGQSVRIGPAETSHRVPYSIASWPELTNRQGWLEFLIKVEPSGEWGDGFPPLQRGSRIEVVGPFGSFVFPQSPVEREYLFVAGGTGIAPLRSMIRHALTIRHPGQYRLLYSARTPSDFVYATELRRLARAGLLDLALTVTREASARWRGEHGRISAERLTPLVRSPETLCFVCGPSAMVDDVPRELRRLGIPQERIRIEDW